MATLAIPGVGEGRCCSGCGIGCRPCGARVADVKADEVGGVAQTTGRLGGNRPVLELWPMSAKKAPVLPKSSTTSPRSRLLLRVPGGRPCLCRKQRTRCSNGDRRSPCGVTPRWHSRVRWPRRRCLHGRTGFQCPRMCVGTGCRTGGCRCQAERIPTTSAMMTPPSGGKISSNPLRAWHLRVPAVSGWARVSGSG